jgi:hypothetical protein
MLFRSLYLTPGLIPSVVGYYALFVTVPESGAEKRQFRSTIYVWQFPCSGFLIPFLPLLFMRFELCHYFWGSISALSSFWLFLESAIWPIFLLERMDYWLDFPLVIVLISKIQHPENICFQGV